MPTGTDPSTVPLEDAALVPRIPLATLGMFILDTFLFLDPLDSTPQGDRGLGVQIGGGGLYFSIGARTLLLPPSIQMIIDCGSDFNHEGIQEKLRIFDRTASPSISTPEGGAYAAANQPTRSMWYLRPRPDGVTTRAVNIYKGEQRGFEYLTPKVRLEVKDLLAASPTDPPTLPEWIHLICSPQRALEIVAQIDTHLASLSRGAEGGTAPPPSFPRLVYEPIPDSCTPQNLQPCLEALQRVAVFSPNHEEAAALLGLTEQWESMLRAHAGEEARQVGWITAQLAHGFRTPLRGSASEPLICIRSGKLGSVIGQPGAGFLHVPAFHTARSEDMLSEVEERLCRSEKVDDVTGAGNAFLGGLTAYLVRHTAEQSGNGGGKEDEREGQEREKERWREAAIQGAVAASLVIEQLGLPRFEVRTDAQGKVEELWNGDSVETRLEVLRRRVARTRAARASATSHTPVNTHLPGQIDPP